VENERLSIFDDDRRPIGTATREDVHRLGHWHETFHCWFVGRQSGKDEIYIQLRSRMKKDYPDLLDITAAGHILSHETVLDGVREIEEELGIRVSPDELVPLGTIDYCVHRPSFIDKEIAHTFLYVFDGGFDRFTLHTDEVSGVYKAELAEFRKLWQESVAQLTVSGFETDASGNRFMMRATVGAERFVPHERSFYRQVIDRIYSKLY